MSIEPKVSNGRPTKIGCKKHGVTLEKVKKKRTLMGLVKAHRKGA